MKSLVEQLSTYKSVHLNKSNIKTHFIGIPLIIWSIAIALSTIGFDLHTNDFSVNIKLVEIVSIIVLAYYFWLSRPLAIFAILVFGPLVYSAIQLTGFEYMWFVAAGAFVIGWILQFIGHAYEKAKPAFVDDLNQLFIGPLFLLAEIYFFLGAEPNLSKSVEKLAIQKRQAFEQSKTT